MYVNKEYSQSEIDEFRRIVIKNFVDDIHDKEHLADLSQITQAFWREERKRNDNHDELGG